MSFGAAGAGFRVIPDQKISKKNLGPKSFFFRSEKAIGPARTGKKKIEKIQKILARRITGPAGPDRHRPGPAC